VLIDEDASVYLIHIDIYILYCIILLYIEKETERERERDPRGRRGKSEVAVSPSIPGRIHVVLRGDGEAINQRKRCLLYYYIRCVRVYTIYIYM